VRRPLTHAEIMEASRVDAELSGGHTVRQTLQFVGALQGREGERSRQLPVGFVPADCEPRWRTRVGRWFGR
jgi:hypothetical protein